MTDVKLQEAGQSIFSDLGIYYADVTITIPHAQAYSAETTLTWTNTYNAAPVILSITAVIDPSQDACNYHLTQNVTSVPDTTNMKLVAFIDTAPGGSVDASYTLRVLFAALET